MAAVAGLAPVHQAYLLHARQMQALSFAVHIPLVCVAIGVITGTVLSFEMGMLWPNVTAILGGAKRAHRRCAPRRRAVREPVLLARAAAHVLGRLTWSRDSCWRASTRSVACGAVGDGMNAPP